jgi:hypothetical protein
LSKNTPSIDTILRMPIHKACGPRGADMGRPNLIGEPGLLYLQHVTFGANDPYDPGGAYWGFPCDLWCAFAGDDKDVIATMIFVRANKRQDAKTKVLDLIYERTGDREGWKFRR